MPFQTLLARVRVVVILASSPPECLGFYDAIVVELRVSTSFEASFGRLSMSSS